MSRRGCLLALLLLAACGRRPAPAPRQPADEPAPPDTAEIAQSTGGTTIVDTDGEPIWHVSGVLRLGIEEGQPSGELLDAQLECLVPGIDATATVGRARYRHGDTEALFDRRLFATWASDGSTLRAEQARFDLDGRRFVIDRPLVAVRRGTRLAARGGEVALDLSRLRLERVTGSGEVEQGRWQAEAAEATGDAAANVVLRAVTGRFENDFGRVDFEAPKAAWKPDLAWLNFAEGVEFVHRGARVSAAAATWESRRRRIVTRGTTRLVRGDLTVTGTGARIDLLTEVASLDGLRLQRGPATLTAAGGTADREGNLTLRDVTGRRDDATVTAARVNYRHGAGTLSAEGTVRLTARGVTATATGLNGPADLSRATMSAVSASGAREGRSWTVTAPSGSWSAGAGLTLERPRARVHEQERTLTATAGQATVSPDGETVRFSGGLHVVSPADGLDVRAERGRYDMSTRSFHADGGVHGRISGLRVEANESWTYDFAPRRPRREPTAGGERPSGEPDGATGESGRPDPGDGQGPEPDGAAADDPAAAG